MGEADECTGDKLGLRISQIDAAAMDTANKSNRHSFCEYKPFSTRKGDLQKLKFFTPNVYQSALDKCDKLTNSNENLSAPDGQFKLLPLIGASQVVAYQNAGGATNIVTKDSTASAFDGNELKTNQDPNIECEWTIFSFVVVVARSNCV